MEKRMISEILDSIKVMTAKELIDLSKACEKEFNVSAALNTVVLRDPKPPVIQKDEFNVELTDYGKQKIKVIKVIREILGLGLKEAKEFVESVPAIIKEEVSIEEAEALKAKIEEQGAVITFKNQAYYR